MAGIGDAKRKHSKNNSQVGGKDLMLWCIPKLTHSDVPPYWSGV